MISVGEISDLLGLVGESSDLPRYSSELKKRYVVRYLYIEPRRSPLKLALALSIVPRDTPRLSDFSEVRC